MAKTRRITITSFRSERLLVRSGGDAPEPDLCPLCGTAPVRPPASTATPHPDRCGPVLAGGTARISDTAAIDEDE